MTKTKVWNQHHYNAVAKEIRELFPITYNEDWSSEKIAKQASRGILAALAVNFATRFNDDWLQAEEGLAFDPFKFLDQCSPDPDMYPLSELWEV